MQKTIYATLLGVAMLMVACGTSENKKEAQSAEQIESERYDLSLADKLGAFTKLTASDNGVTSSTVIKLGHVLYFDNRLSLNNTISCNSCHKLDAFGVDNLPTSPGDAGKNGARNSPTVLNAALHSMQFWDGRAKDVEEQAGMPILNPVEMAIPNEKFLIDRLAKVPMYTELFAAAFPNQNNPVNYKNLQKALGAFERQLITPSRFDEYLAGKMDALSVQEKKGLTSFINTGCTQCHSGALLGGTTIQKFGVHGNYAEYTKSTLVDNGVFDISKNELDKFMFKTPSLRNIEKTGPYFHDGSVTELSKAVEIMAKVQLDYELETSEVENIVAFLKSLTGDFDSKYKSAPAELAKQ